jgi:5-methylcytosine-specific restriction protein A
MQHSGDDNMPYKPKRPCSYPGCPKLTDSCFCEEHRKQEQRNYNRYQRDPETNKRYNGEWKKIRAAYLAAHPLCELCFEAGRFTPATLVHHKIHLRDGGSNNMENLASLCCSCHERLHSKDGSRWHNRNS